MRGSSSMATPSNWTRQQTVREPQPDRHISMALRLSVRMPLISATLRVYPLVRVHSPFSLALTEILSRLPPRVTTRSYQGLSRPACTSTSNPQRANWAAAMPSAPMAMGQEGDLDTGSARTAMNCSSGAANRPGAARAGVHQVHPLSAGNARIVSDASHPRVSLVVPRFISGQEQGVSHSGRVLAPAPDRPDCTSAIGPYKMRRHDRRHIRT